jgi:hypothetical protein
MVTVLVRTPPLLAVTRIVTVPLPAPSAPEAIVIHSALLRAVHLQASCVETAMLAFAAPAAIVRRSGSMPNRHGAASCITRTRLSLITISASRMLGTSLAAATNSTFPAPCPDDGDTFEIQFA